MGKAQWQRRVLIRTETKAFFVTFYNETLHNANRVI